jgi:FixJ family two-component response regulator
MSDPVQTIFVVDDDALFLRAIQRLLRSSGYVTEGFSSAGDFLSRCPREATGCVLADLQMPEMDGLALQAALAQSANPLPVVFLTGQGDIPSSVAAMRGGAEDFLMKTAPKDVVIAAIKRALARDQRERQARMRRLELEQRCESLTPREREVLHHVTKGWRNKQIANEMNIDERSVKRHRTSIMMKLGIGSVAELIQLAVEAGLSPPEQS